MILLIQVSQNHIKKIESTYSTSIFASKSSAGILPPNVSAISHVQPLLQKLCKFEMQKLTTFAPFGFSLPIAASCSFLSAISILPMIDRSLSATFSMFCSPTGSTVVRIFFYIAGVYKLLNLTILHQNKGGCLHDSQLTAHLRVFFGIYNLVIHTL